LKNIIFFIITIFVFVSCTNTPQRHYIILDNNKSIEPLLQKELILVNDDDLLENNNIAMVYASKIIGKYAIEASNIAMSYLISENKNSRLKAFDIELENKEKIFAVLDKLKDQNLTKVIFMITDKNINYLFEYNNLDLFTLYLPLVHKNNLYPNLDNITYGSISYEEQFLKIQENANSNIVEIYDTSAIGNKLHNKLLLAATKDIISYKLKSRNTNFKYFFTKHDLNNTSVILNTSLVKSSIILSQLRVNDINVSEVFSTQVNYSPLLLVLTQKDDRRNLVIANSISKIPKEFLNKTELLGNDIMYNWVNFSVILGMEYLQYNNLDLFEDVNISNNQVKYNINLLDASYYNFKKFKKKNLVIN